MNDGTAYAPTEQANEASEPLGNVSKPVGEQVRELRRSHGLTLADMAKATGRSVGNLSELERGVRPFTLDTLGRIAHTLDVSISWFFSASTAKEDDDGDIVTRKANRRQINLSRAGVREELLSPNLNSSLEMVLTTFRPGACTGPEGRKRKGDEGGMILSGTFELQTEERTVLLKEGDSFQLAGNGTHWCCNPGSTDTVIVWSFCMAKF